MKPRSRASHAYGPKTLNYFKQKINLALDGITLRIENNHHNEPQFLEDLKSIDKRTSRGGELEKHLILMRLDEKDKEDLEAAQTRLDEGIFGFCQKPDCNKVVLFDRLDAIPQAKYCLDCQVEAGKAIIPRKISTKR